MSTLRNKWTLEQEQQLIAMAIAGKTTQQIADRLGIPFHSVAWKRKKLVLAGVLPKGSTGAWVSAGRRKAVPPAHIEPLHLRPFAALTPHERAWWGMIWEGR